MILGERGRTYMIMNPQDAAWLFVDPGGNSAIKMHAMRKHTCGTYCQQVSQ